MRAQMMDDLDQRIVSRLSQDARVSNRQIAADLGVAEGTIRSRIRRLQAEGFLQFTVVTDYRLAGSPNLVMIGIQVEPSRVAQVAKQLAEVPDINCVVVLLGRYSLLAMGLFTSIEQLGDLINSQIRVLEGVREIETSVSVHNIKYEFGIARITSRAETPGADE